MNRTSQLLSPASTGEQIRCPALASGTMVRIQLRERSEAFVEGLIKLRRMLAYESRACPTSGIQAWPGPQPRIARISRCSINSLIGKPLTVRLVKSKYGSASRDRRDRVVQRLVVVNLCYTIIEPPIRLQNPICSYLQ